MRDLRREYTEVELDGLFDRNPNVEEDLSDLECEFEDEYRMVMDALRKKYKNKYKELLGDFKIIESRQEKKKIRLKTCDYFDPRKHGHAYIARVTLVDDKIQREFLEEH